MAPSKLAAAELEEKGLGPAAGWVPVVSSTSTRFARGSRPATAVVLHGCWVPGRGRARLWRQEAGAAWKQPGSGQEGHCGIEDPHDRLVGGWYRRGGAGHVDGGEKAERATKKEKRSVR